MYPFLGTCTFDWLKYDWPHLSDPFWSEFAQSGNKGYNVQYLCKKTPQQVQSIKHWNCFVDGNTEQKYLQNAVSELK